ncbi:hypothetical protein C9374_011840 [Naegleria lovaniensis]|uniref:F-box domain-containing protein n=1 Tax=Naegleria lovaniensis TaxID=51637 RepID=A0AA88GC54_NAELO|nr:uncharacterized protein C9374_011840 [Naegleria lovaniensis]KAG2373751.1 hypothetical protein C9374_011840 [Naegleria lovaniensis]
MSQLQSASISSLSYEVLAHIFSFIVDLDSLHNNVFPWRSVNRMFYEFTESEYFWNTLYRVMGENERNCTEWFVKSNAEHDDRHHSLELLPVVRREEMSVDVISAVEAIYANIDTSIFTSNDHIYTPMAAGILQGAFEEYLVRVFQVAQTLCEFMHSGHVNSEHVHLAAQLWREDMSRVFSFSEDETDDTESDHDESDSSSDCSDDYSTESNLSSTCFVRYFRNSEHGHEFPGDDVCYLAEPILHQDDTFENVDGCYYNSNDDLVVVDNDGMKTVEITLTNDRDKKIENGWY